MESLAFLRIGKTWMKQRRGCYYYMGLFFCFVFRESVNACLKIWMLWISLEMQLLIWLILEEKHPRNLNLLLIDVEMQSVNQ